MTAGELHPVSPGRSGSRARLGGGGVSSSSGVGAGGSRAGEVDNSPTQSGSPVTAREDVGSSGVVGRALDAAEPTPTMPPGSPTKHPALSVHPSTAARPSREVVREAAIANGVCIRPVVTRVADTHTGAVELVPIACGSTREAQCPPCADRARRLRMHQCREGWHLAEEPPEPPPPDPDDGQDPDDPDDGDGAASGEPARRVRSTRRRDDVADLPRLPIEDRTVGQVFTAPDGKRWQPSTFVTLTLPSYGRVHSDGTPVDPDSYDYRRAALDALHFPKLIDRFWQNLRRAVGWKVQYFASIEGQRRLAPHLHAAIRGALRVGDISARQLVRQVVAATYEHLWWPPHEHPVYTDRLPVWNDRAGGYVDPDSGQPLPTWDEALDGIEQDPEATPAHVLRFGAQVDIVGVTPGPKADRLIGYLTKYLAKDIAGDYGTDENMSARRRAHIDRLHEQVRWLPCSPRCANWLRYGIQPAGATDGLEPGACRGKGHRRENLGLGGRRVLVSRRWTGKTLAGHRADRAAVVRQALEAAGINPDDHAQLATDGEDSRYRWHHINPGDLPASYYFVVISRAIETRRRWRHQYETAKTRAGPQPATDPSSFRNFDRQEALR